MYTPPAPHSPSYRTSPYVCITEGAPSPPNAIRARFFNGDQSCAVSAGSGCDGRGDCGLTAFDVLKNASLRYVATSPFAGIIEHG